MFHPLLDDPIALLGVEAAGHGIDTARHAATLTKGRPGVLHGARTILLQDEDGQIQEAHSISAGLDYPGVGPEHAHLRDIGRVRYESVTDAEALAAFRLLARLEGIVPALESAHAVAAATSTAATLPRDRVVVVNLSGRGDKDLDHVMARDAEAGS
jgi:tryptophan synthase beta chain